MVILLPALHLALTFSLHTPAIIHLDENAYVVSARLLSEDGTFARTVEDQPVFQGRLWIDTGKELISKYPPGFPLLLAVVQHLFGHESVYFVPPLLMALAVLAMAWLSWSFFCRDEDSFTSMFYAGLATTFFAFNSTVLIMGTVLFSHAASLCAVLFLLLAAHCASGSGRVQTWALVGLLAGLVITIRYSEMILLAPFLLAFLFCSREDSRLLPRGLWFLLGLALPLMALAYYNFIYFGAPFRTGYAYTDEETAFALKHILTNGPLLLEKFVLSGAGILLPLALWRIFRGQGMRARKWFAGTWILLPFLFFGVYYWQPNINSGMYNSIHMRFLLPMLPVLILCAVDCLKHVIKNQLVSLVLIVIVLVTGLRTLAPEHDYIRERGETIHTFSQKFAPLVKSDDILFAPVSFLDAVEYDFELTLVQLLYLDYAHEGGRFWQRRRWFRQAGATSDFRHPTYHQFARRKMAPALFNAADAKELNRYWHNFLTSAEASETNVFVLLSGLNRSALEEIARFEEKFHFTPAGASEGPRTWFLYQLRAKDLSAGAAGAAGSL